MANVTIDDTDPSIAYLPYWIVRNASVPCPACAAKPEVDMMYNETWHDSTFNANAGSGPFANIPITASVLFNGTALYVFCALAEAAFGDSDMSFYIDGELKGTFVQIALDENLYDYNVPVFTIESLAPDEHNFTLQGGHVNSGMSLVLLDRMVYTAFDSTSASSSPSSSLPSTSVSSTSTPSKTSLWRIIGPTVAVTVVVLLLIAVALWFFFKRRKQRYKGKQQATTLNPSSLEYSSSGVLASPTLRPQRWSPRAASDPVRSQIQPQTSNTAGDMSAEALGDDSWADVPPLYNEVQRVDRLHSFS